MKPTDQENTSCMAFAGTTRVARGTPQEVALASRAWLDSHSEQNILFFDCDTGQQIELDLRGSQKEILARLAPAEAPPVPKKRPGPGRPKLGVVCQEICLLPRHWEWLASQPQSASATLRRLVEDARKANAGKDRARRSQEAAHKFMWAMAGNLPSFEEATRAFYAKDYPAMKAMMQDWPNDVRDTLWELVERTKLHEEQA
jgi:uncharacterized protein